MLKLSIYSDISRRIIESSEPKIKNAKAFANSVFPTPVGPAKIKLAIGRVELLNPRRERRIARPIALTATF